MTLNLIQHAADLFDITLSAEQALAFDRLQAELLDWNTRINLTAITDEDAIRVRHFLDSLSVGMVANLCTGLSLLDIGTGAGFPGLALAIAFPQAQITLMDATAKKLTFIQHIIDTFHLGKARTIHARAEDAGQDRAHREKYDVAVARAVARLPALLEYGLPFVRVGGAFIAMKGTTAFEEVEDSGVALRTLGGKVDDIVPIQLPTMDYPHHLILVSKVKPTPKAYPRQPGIPTREPLGE